jgi:hypothetical protein
MTTVLSVLGAWLLVSLPFAMFIGSVCRLNRLNSQELPISDELPITTTPAAAHAAVGAVRILA